MGWLEEVPRRRRGASVLYWGVQHVLDANAVSVGLQLNWGTDHSAGSDP